MRLHALALASLIVACPPWAAAQYAVSGQVTTLPAVPAASASSATALTLDEAWRLATAANPAIRARLAQLAAAEARRAGGRFRLPEPRRALAGGQYRRRSAGGLRGGLRF